MRQNKRPSRSGGTKPRKVKNPVVLIVLDGWGIAPAGKYNAISLAKTPNFQKMKEEFGAIEICASGVCVGLTEGQMGNSEVGHLTIGSGRIIFQDLMRVNEEIASGRLAKNQKLLNALNSSKKAGRAVHFLGLLSLGGVHSHIEHLFALLRIAKTEGISSTFVHVILDGRDTPPRSGTEFVSALRRELNSIGIGKIATISGRYYAMDRDARWDRTKKAYDAIVYGDGIRFDDPVKTIEESYSEGVNDEFVIPRVSADYSGIKDDDVVIFYNFRPDRARQLTEALSLNARQFGNLFDRREDARPKKVTLVTMTVYDTKLKNVYAILGREHVSKTLSNILERNSIRQLRIAETEKYAHVTYFFNGLVEKQRKFEDRILAPSLKEVGTYDKAPEMSARAIAKHAVATISEGRYGFTLINFANADMVGHSGNLEATIKAVETVDYCLGEILAAWREKRRTLSLVVTADHGNAEKMFDECAGQPHTAHTSNPVPFCVVSDRWEAAEPSNGESGGLRDVAPTVLKIMGLEKPSEMTGSPLIRERHQPGE